MKRLSTLFMFLCLAATATGQIVTLHLKDSKAARRYKKNVVKINGDWAIVGEPFRGPIVKGQNITITEEMTLFVVDPARPDRVPYRLVGGEKVPAKGKRTTLTVSRDYVTKVTIYSNRETLAGLANEYRIKLEGAERLADERSKVKRFSPEWFAIQQRMVSAYERLRDWLQSTVYPAAAKKLEKKIKSESRHLKEDAPRERARAGQQSVKGAEQPDDLIALSREVTKGRIRFRSRESLHVRIIYEAGTTPDALVPDLLRFSERIVEGWRRRFLDPHATGSEDDWVSHDMIPDEIIAEFFFSRPTSTRRMAC